MRKILLLPIILLAFCSLKNDKPHADEVKIMNERWVNSKYLECLKTNLPCNCLDNVNTSTMTFVADSLKPYILEYGNNSDYDLLYYKKNNSNHLNIYSSSAITSQSLIGTITLNEEKLDLQKKTVIESFTKIKFSSKTLSTDFLDDINSIYLDTLFSNIIDKSFSNLINEKLISCSCNRDLGSINMVKSENKYWIVELETDSIFVYEFFPKINKSYPVVIDKKILHKYSLMKR